MNPLWPLVLTLVAGTYIATASPARIYMKPCSTEDPEKFEECNLKNVQTAVLRVINGIPELGLRPLDPFHIVKIVLGEGGSFNAPLSLSLVLNNVTILGFRDIQVLPGTKTYLEESRFVFNGLLPLLHIQGMYSMDGRVLLLPIKGEGHANITVGNLSVNWETNFSVVKGKDGKGHFRLDKVQLDMHAQSCSLYFDNLFNGDKALGSLMNNFLNENWREVLDEFGPAITATAKKIVKIIFVTLGEHVSYEDAFDRLQT